MADQTSRSRRAQRARRRHRRQLIRGSLAVGLVAVLIGIGIVVVVVTRSDADDDVAVVTVDLVEFGFDGALVAPAGPVRLAATNRGVIPHNIGLRGGPITSDLPPGGTAQLDLGALEAGTYELYCDVADHVAQGMVASLVIEEPEQQE